MNEPDRALSAALGARRTAGGAMRILRWLAALVLLVIGVVFGFVPLIPGVPFVVLALFLIAPDFPAARRASVIIMRKVPIARRTVPRSIRRMGRRPRTPPEGGGGTAPMTRLDR